MSENRPDKNAADTDTWSVLKKKNYQDVISEGSKIKSYLYRGFSVQLLIWKCKNADKFACLLTVTSNLNYIFLTKLLKISD